MKRNKTYNSNLPSGINPEPSRRKGMIGRILLTLCLMMVSMGAWAQTEITSLSQDTQFEPDQDTIEQLAGKLVIYSKRGRIIIESNIARYTMVNIHNISGVCIASFTIAPGETIVQPVDQSGVYVVNTQKLLVK